MSISEQDRQRISTAIRNAETKTSSEIVCVLAQSSSDAKALPIFIAAVVALALPWLLVALTAMSVQRILLLQILVFVALTALLCLPRARVALMPRAARRAVAHRVAMEQFTIRGLTHKKDRAGILIFVSLAERYARIIVDDDVAARVPRMVRKSFPNLNFWGTADLIAEDDHVVGRWEGGGTHTGPAFKDFLAGSLPAATGRKMHFTGMTVLRMQNGKIIEEIGLDDGVTALTQLGLLKKAA